MEKKQIITTYEVYESIESLNEADQVLLQAAHECTDDAYAPYSEFYVGCAIRYDDDQIITGTNQENASFPVGLCAERVALSAIDSLHPGAIIHTLAVTAASDKIDISAPISPCGNCRQAIAQAEIKSGNAIRIILQGMSGPIYVFDSIVGLLPMVFDLKT